MNPNELLVPVDQVCPVCRIQEVRYFDPGRYLRWKHGELVQSAFDNLSLDEREWLISGTHSKCWDELFGADDG